MKTTVEIIWDKPEEQQWLNADNIALALHAYCPNTKFEVSELNTTKNILTEQSNHSINACLKELRFNRPADAQRHIDKLIAISNIIV